MQNRMQERGIQGAAVVEVSAVRAALVAVVSAAARAVPAADNPSNIALQKITFSRADDSFVKAFLKKELANTCTKMAFARIQFRGL